MFCNWINFPHWDHNFHHREKRWQWHTIANNWWTMSRTRGGKTRRDERSDDESEDEEKRASMGRGATVNEWLTERCQLLESTVKSLQSEIRVLKSSAERKMKCQLRINYYWDGENANLSDKVSNWVKTYLFPWYKFLKDGWMAACRHLSKGRWTWKTKMISRVFGRGL